MECHAVLLHVPFVKQGELVVVFLLAFALHSLPDSHHLHHQKLHHRCSVQNLEYYLLRLMKRSEPTRHFRLHLLIQTIQLHFWTFPRCLNLLCPQNHSKSFLELPGQEILASLPTFFPILPNSPHTFSQHDKNKMAESYRRSYSKKTKDACMEHWQLIVTSLLSNKDPKGQIHIWCADDLTAAFKILMC